MNKKWEEISAELSEILFWVIWYKKKWLCSFNMTQQQDSKFCNGKVQYPKPKKCTKVRTMLVQFLYIKGIIHYIFIYPNKQAFVFKFWNIKGNTFASPPTQKWILNCDSLPYSTFNKFIFGQNTNTSIETSYVGYWACSHMISSKIKNVHELV